ncbi:MAG: PTS ascorbate transporter subunit IIC [Clostridium sp.]
MDTILSFFNDFLSEPALLMGLMAFIGLVALRRPGHKIMTGTLKPILGYLMLGAGADFIVSNLNPLGEMIQEGFNITGIIPNNEAIVSLAQTILGVETMSILVVGLIVNLIVARFTKFKYIFLTGHHSLFMACLLSAVLQTTGLEGGVLIGIGGAFLGLISAILPAIGQKYTLKVTDGDEVAMGHFGSLAYYISAWIGGKVGNPEDSTEDVEIPEKWSFLRDTTISTALTMMAFYLVAAFAAGPEFVATLSGGKNMILFSLISAMKFSVGVTVVYSGVRMILGDLLPAFQGIATKIIPNAIPAVDCAVFFTYAQTAVVIGFIASFIGGVIGMVVLGALGGVLIIPGLVPHFFCGATAGIYGNSTGGKKGAVVGAFVNGLLISFIPALLLPVLGNLGFQNTTFGDFDFGVIGITIGKVYEFLGNYGVFALLGILVAIVIIPNFIKTKNKVVNNVEEEEEVTV